MCYYVLIPTHLIAVDMPITANNIDTAHVDMTVHMRATYRVGLCRVG